MSDDIKVIKFELPEVANKALEPLATSIGTTLSDLWSGVFGGISFWSDKKEIERKANLELYKQLIERKLSMIDINNLQEPKVSIVGPAIEASKYYFEEKQYREMFSNLIASASDKSKCQDVHSSFTEIIKQLEPNDAVWLSSISHALEGITPLLKIDMVSSIGSHSIDKNFSALDDSMDSHKRNAFSIDNLLRLNLISVTYDEEILNENIYKEIEEKYFYIDKIKEYSQWAKNISTDSNKRSIETTEGFASITTYGISFTKICLSDSE